jgi:hypothetical protein
MLTEKVKFAGLLETARFVGLLVIWFGLAFALAITAGTLQ